MRLTYTTPATRWEESLPLGNGSLGALIWGGVERDVVGLNEETLWSGYPRDKTNPQALTALPLARRFVFEGRYREAEQLIQEKMLGEYGESYLPLGSLVVRWRHPSAMPVEAYRRTLDLKTAESTVTYECNGTAYLREALVSFPQRALFLRYTATAQALSFEMDFETLLAGHKEPHERGFLFRGQCPEHVDPHYVEDSVEPVIQGTRGRTFWAAFEVLSCDGIWAATPHGLSVSGASEFVLSVSAVREAHHHRRPWAALRKEHQEDYRQLYDRVDIDLGPESDEPTDQRLARAKLGTPEPSLFALFFQYGRYLLISSSREGSLPANLQGLWNWHLRAPWSSNWTTNINVQMNYWLAQVGNLPECLGPYFDLVERLAEDGRRTAQRHYGCRGFVHHHNADVWANTQPVGLVHGETAGREDSVTWSFWPLGGAWMVSELWRHYEYRGDRGFLRDTAYPLLREAALFLCDWLVEHEGELVTCPSTSPENRFATPGGSSAVGHSCALDGELIREVFGNLRRACSELGIDDPLLAELDAKQARLRPLGVGSRGQLLEWHEEFPETEPGHRHLSHLYGLFPSELFHGDQELTEACRRSLAEREAAGSGQTGWSCAWFINLYAVLGDREKTGQFLDKLLREATWPNLWGNHPPFQIDANFGGAAGIANALVQDRGGEVRFLPALPPAWKEGWVRGLSIKGGRTVELRWKEGTLVESHLRGPEGP